MATEHTIVDDIGRTPLHLAALHGFLDIVTSLLKDDVSLSAEEKISMLNKTDNFGRTPLHLAAMGKNNVHVDIARYLISQGSHVDANTTEYKETPLAIAAFHDNSDMAAVLVSAGADINSQKTDGQTPFTLAVRYGRWQLVDALLTRIPPHSITALQTARESLAVIENNDLRIQAQERITKSIETSAEASARLAASDEKKFTDKVADTRRKGCCHVM